MSKKKNKWQHLSFRKLYSNAKVKLYFKNSLQQWWTNLLGRKNQDTPYDRHKMGIRICCQTTIIKLRSHTKEVRESLFPTTPTQNPHHWTGIVISVEKKHIWPKFVISVTQSFSWSVAMCVLCRRNSPNLSEKQKGLPEVLG